MVAYLIAALPEFRLYLIGIILEKLQVFLNLKYDKVSDCLIKVIF